MEPQQRPFDEKRLVKPGEWDALANFDENAVTEMEKAVDDEILCSTREGARIVVGMCEP